MADAPKLYSVAVVLHGCYNSREDVNAVLRSLRKAELITEDDLSKLSSLEEASSAYGPIINRMGELDEWVEKFKSACMDKGFPGDGVVKKLLCKLAEAYDETVERLLGVWNEMDLCKNTLLRLSREMWPDKISSIEQGKKPCPWQLYLVSICSAEENKEKVLVFVETTLRFLERWKSNKTRQEKIRWHFRLIIHPSTPDNWDVFVRVIGSGMHVPATKYTFSAMRECYVTDIEMSHEVESISYNIYSVKRGGISKSLYYGTEKAVRKYEIGADEACRGHVILYDVVNTEGGTNDNGWTENLRLEMKRFLPRPRYLNTKSSEDEIPLAWKLDGWLNQILVGWNIASNLHGQNSVLRSVKLEEIPAMMELSLRYWAAQLRIFPSDESHKCWYTKRRIIGLILLLGLTQRRHVVEDLETFVEIFKSLSIHEIDGLEQEALYKELMAEHCFLNDDVPTPSSVFQTLFRRLKFKLMTEWILALPLYWLIVKNGVFPIQFTEDIALRWPLAELPRIEECDWKEVKLKASNDISQLSLMNMLNIVAETAKAHPWIVRPYLDMMRGKNILLLISDRPIDAKFLPPVIVIAKLLWSVRQKEADLSLDDLEKHAHYIFTFLKKLETELDYQSTTYGYAKAIASEALDCAKSCEYWPGILWCTDVIFAAIDWTKPQHTHPIFPQLIELLKRQIVKPAPSEFPKTTGKQMERLEAWNHVTFISWRVEHQRKLWSNKLIPAMRKKLDQKWTNDMNEDFLRTYLKTKETIKLSKHLQEMMEEKCHDCIEYVLKNSKPVKQTLTRFLGGINRDLYSSLDRIFEDIFTKAMKTHLASSANDRKDTAMKFILTWKPAVVFYQKFYTKKLKTRNIKFVTHSFCECLDKIKKSEVQMKHLKTFVDHKEVAIELKAAIEKESSVDYDKSVKQLLDSTEKRYRRIDRIHKILINLKVLLEFLSNRSGLSVKPDCITREVPADISSCRLDALTSLLEFVTDEMIEEFEWLSKMMESRVFSMCWKNIGKHVDTELVEKSFKGLKGTFGMALDVWRRTKDEMHSLSLQLLSGQLELRFLHMWFDEKAADFVREELKKLYWHSNKIMPEASTTISEDRVDHIANQVNEYMKLRKCKTAIDVVLMIKDALSITGDYAVFEKLQRMMDFGDETMMNIPKHAIEHLAGLEEILMCTPQLKQFILETEFIEWIHKNIAGADGITDMGDLALTTEEEMITVIVNGFTNAVTGFSPLIFNIRGQKISFDNLCVKIRKVYRNIRSNPFLVEQWSESASKKALFEEIEYRMGSLEKQCLATAKSINEKGVYIVKSPKRVPESPDDVLQVTLPHYETKKTMTFNKIEELQASLTLVTEQDEKSKQIISAFSALFSAMENVSKALVSLLKERCMLFFNFSIHVSPSSHSTYIISTSFCDEAPLTGTYDVSYVENLASILENTKQKWVEYVNNKRHDHYSLNEYNVDQVSYLCHKLGLLIEDHKLPDQALSLLSLTTSLHPSKMREILVDTDKARQKNTPELHLNTETAGEEETSDCVKAKRWLQAVRDMEQEQDVTNEQAKAAFISTLDDEDESPEEWLLLNRNDEDHIARRSKEFDERIAFLTPGPTELPTISYSFDGQRLNLPELLNCLQQSPCDSLSSVRTVCDNFIDRTKIMTLTDYISIEHLGAFLDKARNVCPAETLNRSLPSDSFKVGRPNLIVCSENNVYSNILKLYIGNSNEPLPTMSEVLICSENTSIDPLERFMRRAVGKCETKGKPLFCLAFCDRLQFNVMKAVDEKFNDLKSGKEDAEYQLVIFCCDRKSYLATTFENFEVTWIADLDNDDVSRHLEAKLKAPINYDTSPASLYQDRSLVKIVVSGESGNGKSLYVRRQRERLSELRVLPRITTIRCLQDTMDYTAAASKLVSDSPAISYTDPNFIHIDISTAVKNGIDEFIFNLIILGGLQSDTGFLWRRHENHLYLVEITDKNVFEDAAKSRPNGILDFLPKVKAFAPTEVLERNSVAEGDSIGMDKEEFLTETFQRPYQYLTKHTKMCLDSFSYSTPEGTPEKCLQALLSNFPGRPPSWAQLKGFASFLNVQLRSCEKSEYCNPKSELGMHLRGLKDFVVKFMIRMSQDFATPTTVLSDESGNSSDTEEKIQTGGSSKERRKWEDSIHPYIFFNDDHQTMTFLNVNLTHTGHLIDYEGRIIEENITTSRLVQALSDNLGPLREISEGSKDNCGPAIFSVKLENNRPRMLQILCQVMGVRDVFDPDSSYELTVDNVQKILAIYMRFRCHIPVVLLGETGCGKTRMVEFLSSFLRRARSDKLSENGKIRENMIVRKVYGGITALDIYESVAKARNVLKNIEDEKTDPRQDESKNSFGVILFYDEANTTEAIFAIKEVMCDSTVDGEDSFCDEPLYIVAACNPYKKLSKAAIARLETSGLGFQIHASQKSQKISQEMRYLLYKVVQMPTSMKQYIWDFGQVNTATERQYVSQMVQKLKTDASDHLSYLISEMQAFMRKQDVECRFVSLRDVERCITVYEWFFNRKASLFPLFEAARKIRYQELGRRLPDLPDDLRALLHTIGVCYYYSLQDRDAFRKHLCKKLSERSLVATDFNDSDILEEFLAAHSAFLNDIVVGETVFRNQALMENFFMMAVCADTKIPLFVVGKPGSSKSLAKTILSGNMQGNLSRTELFKRLKQVRLLSYQCSAQSEATGIRSVFDKCALLQEGQDPTKYAAVVVLDELGLAEHSPNMPLKILHPLLESGTTSGRLTNVDQKKKVGFIGISNWCLDPAKLNRGIFILREEPGEDDLLKTSLHISSLPSDIRKGVTKAYMKIYRGQGGKNEREMFGLRDFYSLIKMIPAEADLDDGRRISMAIYRNFDKEGTLAPGDSNEIVFRENLPCPLVSRSIFTVGDFIKENLKETETRFLLLVSNNYPSINLLPKFIKGFETKAVVIFGSSFPGDHNHAEVCRNINAIKICMDTGKLVILLNMADVHESLYDALNQHFVIFGGKRYVDLGLGAQRVKCHVAPEFRMIILEQKDTARKIYPIPLLSRLEKHSLNARDLLKPEESRKILQLENWIESLFRKNKFRKKDALMGYHDDLLSSALLIRNRDVAKCKESLFQCATMDSILRLPPDESTQSLRDTYQKDNTHSHLLNLLQATISSHAGEKFIRMFEILTFSHVLLKNDRVAIEENLNLSGSVMVLNLEEFQTRRQFQDKIELFLGRSSVDIGILVIQCSKAEEYGELMECAKHEWETKAKMIDKKKLKRSIIAIFLWSLERNGSSLENAVRSASARRFVMHFSETYEIAYVDEVSLSGETVPPSNWLFCHTRQESFLSDTERAIRLVKGCLSSSVGRIHTRHTFRLLKLLTTLCNETTDAAKDFQTILVKKVASRLARLDNSDASGETWFTREARNHESLQEGGTFQKALILSLKNAISGGLIELISNINRFGNLELLLKCHKKKQKAWKTNMWLEMFDRLDAEDYKKSDVDLNSEQDGITCSTPYLFRIAGHCEEIWNEIAEKHPEKVWKPFIRQFRRAGFCKILADATRSSKVVSAMQEFARDLIIVRSPSGANHVEATLSEILYQVAWKRRSVLTKEQPNDFEDGDEFPLIYATFKEIEVSDMTKILSTCPRISPQAHTWLDKQKPFGPCKLHILALQDCFGVLHKDTQSFEKPLACREWQKLSASLKTVILPMLDKMGTGEDKAELMRSWMSFCQIDLLLLNLIPRKNEERPEEQGRYESLIGPEAKLVLKGVRKKQIEDFKQVRIFSSLLETCYNKVKLNLEVSWGTTICKRCGRTLKSPWVLPCKHAVCCECYKFLVDNTKKCPQCQNPIDETARAVQLTKEGESELALFKARCTAFFLQYLKEIVFGPVSKICESKWAKEWVKSLLAVIVQSKGQKQDIFTGGIELDLNTKASILGILLENCYEQAVADIEDCFNMDNEDDKKSFVEVALYYYEQQLAREHSPTTLQRNEFWIRLLGEHAEYMQEDKIRLQCLDTMRSISHIRLGIKYLVREIPRLMEKESDKLEEVRTLFRRLSSCVEKETIRKFFMKCGWLLFGPLWCFSAIKCKENMPIELADVKENMCYDFWAVFGRQYLKAKGALSAQPAKETQQTIDDLARKGNPIHALAIIDSLQNIEKDLKSHAEEKIDSVDYGKGKLRVASCSRLITEALSKVNEIRQPEVFILHRLLLTTAVVVADPNYLLEEFFEIANRPDAVSVLAPPEFLRSPEKNISEQSLVLQIILDACVVLGMIRNADAVRKSVNRMLPEDVSEDQLPIMLLNSLKMNLRNLASAMEMRIDDAALLVHIVLRKIMSDDQEPETKFIRTTTEERLRWKREFEQKYLNAIFGDLHSRISKAKQTIEEDFFKTEFHRLVNGTSQLRSETFSLRSEILWNYTKNISLEDFRGRLETSSPREGIALKLLFQFDQLHLTKYLETVLILQNNLILKCKNIGKPKTLVEADAITVEEYVCDNVENKRLAQKYIELWNLVSFSTHSFPTKSAASKLPTLMQRIDMKSPLSMILPGSRGRGKCAKFLVEGLASIHNEFLKKCEENGISQTSLEPLPLHRLRHSHYIDFDLHEHLLPILQLNTIYHEPGENEIKPSLFYNIEAVEKLVREKYVNYKRQILITDLPCMNYFRDTELASAWQVVKGKYKPENLSTSLATEADDVASRLTTTCSVVRILAQAIGYMATEKVELDEKLNDFLANKLQLSATEIHGIPNRARVRHTLSLYLRFSWHRSRMFVARNANPFAKFLDKNLQEHISEVSVVDSLMKNLHETKIELLQQLLNEVIVCGLDFSPESSIIDDIFPTYEFLWLGGDGFDFKLPCDIRFKHIQHLFEIAFDYENGHKSVRIRHNTNQTEDGFNEGTQVNLDVPEYCTDVEHFGPDGGIMELKSKDCTLILPPNVVEDITEIQMGQLIDSGIWPEGHLAVCPVLVCRPSGLNFSDPVIMQVGAWSDIESSEKAIRLFRQDEGGNWRRQDTEVTRLREFQYQFQATHFTRFFLGYLLDAVANILWPLGLQHRIKTWLCQNTTGRFCSIVCLDNDALVESIEERLKNEGYTPTFPLPLTFVAYSGDEIAVQLQSQDPGVRIRNQRGYSIKIDREFLTKLQQPNYFSVTLYGDIEQSTRLEMTYILSKNGEVTENPFSYLLYALDQPIPAVNIYNAQTVDIFQ